MNLGLVLSILVAAPVAVEMPPASGRFERDAPMSEARSGHTATLLADGRVLVLGGRGASGAALGSAEIYDPAARAFAPAGMMQGARVGHSATALADGRVFIAGGDPYGSGLATTEFFDPATGAFTAGPDLAAAQLGHAAVRLGDGRVLIAGGLVSSTTSRVPRTADAQVFDPQGGAFQPTSAYAFSSTLYPAAGGPIWPKATLLDDGTVLLVANALAESFQPSDDAFTPAAALMSPGYRYGMWGHTATRLLDGGVLVTGGSDEWSLLADADRYDPETTLFIALPRMTAPRCGHTATLLQSGTVLLTGGETQIETGSGGSVFGGSLASTEVFDPVAGVFVPGPAMHERRTGHTATALSDGTVLIIGGTSWAGIGQGVTLASAERHVPADPADLLHWHGFED